jgi:signal transduction histidine kinase
MRLTIPALIVAVFLALAAASLTVGGLLARRTAVERVERERGSHEQLAAELGAELQRLEALYESHLRHLLALAEHETGIRFVNECRNIVGVRHFSRLHRNAGGDLQIDCRWPGMTAVPVPVLPNDGLFPGVQRRELQPERLYGEERKSGWLREPAWPALYIQERGGTARILTIDEAEVRTAMEQWLRGWSGDLFAQIAAGHGRDRIVSPGRGIVASSGVATSSADGAKAEGGADWVLPVPSRLGTWRIESWDERTTRRWWHLPTLAWSVTGAVLAVVAGMALATRVRRERQLAEQRVSFVNRVSHELRTPLTNMLLNLDATSEQIEEGTASRRLGLVREEARRLSRLIENVLTFSRGERSRVDVQARAGNPAAVLDAVIEQFAPSFARRGITVRRNDGTMRRCMVDADALAQIAANLLSNVEKYAPAEVVEIATHFDGDEFVLTVADGGPGIPASAVERVFQPFERLSSSVTEGVTGTGLGLSIARELAHRMGGTLRLRPGKKGNGTTTAATGATFELRVPAPAVPELSSSTAA